MSQIRTQTGNFYYAKYQFKRSFLENALDNNYTTDERAAALKFFGGCAFCGTKDAPRNDHLIAVFQYGDFIAQNVVPACQKCDDSKGQKEYHEWMRNSTSKRSLRGRGMESAEIEKRIKTIENWQNGYKPRSEKALFGKYYGKYRDILERMNGLCQEAESITIITRAGHRSK